MSSVLVIAAHPDDEVLGCGGTIAKHVDAEDSVSILFMTNGVSARDDASKLDVEQRQSSAKEALEALGVDFQHVTFCDFPDNQLDTVPLIEVVKSVEVCLNKTRPRIVYTHFSDDLNVDHRVTHQAVMTACRPQKHSPVKEIYCYEVLSSTEWNSYSRSKFNPNLYIDISDTWERKSQALNAYSQELRDFPHSRSLKAVEAQETLRGACVGLEKAEAFQIERVIKE